MCCTTDMKVSESESAWAQCGCVEKEELLVGKVGLSPNPCSFSVSFLYSSPPSRPHFSPSLVSLPLPHLSDFFSLSFFTTLFHIPFSTPPSPLTPLSPSRNTFGHHTQRTLIPLPLTLLHPLFIASESSPSCIPRPNLFVTVENTEVKIDHTHSQHTHSPIKQFLLARASYLFGHGCSSQASSPRLHPANTMRSVQPAL